MGALTGGPKPALSVLAALGIACAGAPPARPAIDVVPPAQPAPRDPTSVAEPTSPELIPRDPASAPEPIAPAAPDPDAAREAEAAYRRIQRAYGAGEIAEYRRGYANPMQCFYGRAGVRNTRRPDDAPGVEQDAMPIEIRVLEATPSGVLLVDTGVYASERSIRPHHKLVRLERIEGRWRITAEASLHAPGCMTLPAGIDADDLAPGQRFAWCERRYDRCARRDTHRLAPDLTGGCVRRREPPHARPELGRSLSSRPVASVQTARLRCRKLEVGVPARSPSPSTIDVGPHGDGP